MEDYTLPERSSVALLTVNAQRDFTLPGSPMKAAGACNAVPGMGRLAKAFRAEGLPILHAVRMYRPDGSNVDICRRKAVEDGLRILMPGSSGVDLVDEVKPSPDVRLHPDWLFAGSFQDIGPREWIFYKPRWGAFHNTALEQHLRNLNVTTIVLCGCNFATSVRATIYEATARDLRVVLVPDAVSGTTEEGVRELGRIGLYLVDSEDCLSWLAKPDGSTVAA